MAVLACTNAAKVADDRGARFLVPGAFWLEGERYTVSLVEAIELLTLFPKSFTAEDDEAKVAAARAKG